jgi:cell division transport system permease protein
MKPRTISYYFKEAFRSIFKNRMMSVASIFAVTSSIFIVAVFYILGANVEFFVRQLEETMGLVVFVDEEVGRDQAALLTLEGRILAVPHVAGVTFRSRFDALEQFRHMVGNNENLIRGLEADPPWRDSFEVELSNLAFQEDVARAIEGLSHYGAADIRRQSDMAETLTALSAVVNIITLAFIVVLAGISVIIITNTIRITVNARRSEINIMKYVGATDWFVRWPFVLEGMLIGFIGGIIPAVITRLGYDRVIAAVASIPALAFVDFMPGEEIFMYVFPLAIGLGTLIGLTGSSWSVKKHLKV